MEKAKQIQIKNYTWVIIEVEEFKDSPENEIAFGRCDYVNQVIRINANLSKQQKRQTLLHELTHAFMQAYGLGQVSDTIPVEVMCDFLGTYADDMVKIADEWAKGR